MRDPSLHFAPKAPQAGDCPPNCLQQRKRDARNLAIQASETEENSMITQDNAEHELVSDLAIHIAKAIRDLDDLVRLLIRALAPAKPWQRHLLIRLARIAQEIQVLRMTIALDRGFAEQSAAAIQLHASLASTVTEMVKGRTDVTTKAAMRLALGLGKRVREAFVMSVPSEV